MAVGKHLKILFLFLPCFFLGGGWLAWTPSHAQLPQAQQDNDDDDGADKKEKEKAKPKKKKPQKRKAPQKTKPPQDEDTQEEDTQEKKGVEKNKEAAGEGGQEDAGAEKDAPDGSSEDPPSQPKETKDAPKDSPQAKEKLNLSDAGEPSEGEEAPEKMGKEGASAEKEPSDEKKVPPSDAKPSDEKKPTETKPSDAKPSDEKKPTETKPSDAKPSDTKASDAKPAGVELQGTKGGKTIASPTLTWHLRILGVSLLFFLLSFGFLLLHFLLPIRILRFLGSFSHFFFLAGTFSIGGLWVSRVLWWQRWPVHSFFDGLVWFVLCASLLYLFQRREMRDVHLGSLALLPIQIGALLWAATGRLQPRLVDEMMLSPLIQLGWSFGYAALAGLAVGASWSLSSGYLGLLARRERGEGYGLSPDRWLSYHAQSHTMLLWSYPILTLACVFLGVESLQRVGEMGHCALSMRAWSLFLSWPLLSAAMLSLRMPILLEIEGEPWLGKERRALPAFLLLLTAATSAALFIFSPALIAWLQG
jgi:hypothetical protein